MTLETLVGRQLMFGLPGPDLGDADIGHGHARGRVTLLGIARDVADQQDLVERGHRGLRRGSRGRLRRAYELYAENFFVQLQARRKDQRFAVLGFGGQNFSQEGAGLIDRVGFQGKPGLREPGFGLVRQGLVQPLAHRRLRQGAGSGGFFHSPTALYTAFMNLRHAFSFGRCLFLTVGIFALQMRGQAQQPAPSAEDLADEIGRAHV